MNALKLAAIDCSEVYDFVDSIKSEQVLLTIEEGKDTIARAVMLIE